MNLGVLVSGRGSHLQAIIDACKSCEINAQPVVVICNNSSAIGLERARKAAIDTAHLSSVTHPDPTLLDKAICTELVSHDVDLVVLAGYAKQIGPTTLETFRKRMINVHPSLLPAFGGKGMYGAALHEAVIASHVAETGVSVHLVEGEYDQGPILAQTRVPVRNDDTPETLANRLLPEEHRLYVDTIARIARGELPLAG